MPTMTKLNIGRVLVPVADQDAAIEWYEKHLGFTKIVDIPFGDGDRWVELAAPGGGAGIALTPGRDEFQPGRQTGIALDSHDPLGDHQRLSEAGVDCDPPIGGGDDPVPPLFFFRDGDGNGLMIVQRPDAG